VYYKGKGGTKDDNMIIFVNAREREEGHFGGGDHEYCL
jgi:hypothetical protein